MKVGLVIEDVCLKIEAHFYQPLGDNERPITPADRVVS